MTQTSCAIIDCEVKPGISIEVAVLLEFIVQIYGNMLFLKVFIIIKIIKATVK